MLTNIDDGSYIDRVHVVFPTLKIKTVELKKLAYNLQKHLNDGDENGILKGIVDLTQAQHCKCRMAYQINPKRLKVYYPWMSIGGGLPFYTNLHHDRYDIETDRDDDEKYIQNLITTSILYVEKCNHTLNINKRQREEVDNTETNETEEPKAKEAKIEDITRLYLESNPEFYLVESLPPLILRDQEKFTVNDVARWINDVNRNVKMEYEVYGIPVTQEGLVDTLIKKFNEHFIFIVHTNEVVFVDYEVDLVGAKFWNSLSYLKWKDNWDIYKFSFPVSRGQGKTKTIKTISIPFGTTWKKNIHRIRKFDNMVFDPRPVDLQPQYMRTCFNRFQGLLWTEADMLDAVRNLNEEERKLVNFFVKHMKFVICSDGEGGYDEDKARYLTNWFAAKIRYPWKKLKVVTVFSGHEGNGKSLFVNVMMKIFSPYNFTTASMNQVLKGTFNFQFKDRLFVLLEEGFWAGNHEAGGKFKALITEETLEVEQKFKDRTQIVNSISFCMTTNVTNSGWIVPAGDAARRFAIFNCADIRRSEVGDKKYDTYFTKLAKCLKNEKVNKAIIYKLVYDVEGGDAPSEQELEAFGEGFNIPKSLHKALSIQKEITADSVTLFWKESLLRGYHLYPVNDWMSSANGNTDAEAKKLRSEFNGGRVQGEDYDYENDQPIYKPKGSWLEIAIIDQIYSSYCYVVKHKMQNKKTMEKIQFICQTETLFPDFVKKVKNRHVIVTPAVISMTQLKMYPIRNATTDMVVEASNLIPSGVSLKKEVGYCMKYDQARELFMAKSGLTL